MRPSHSCLAVLLFALSACGRDDTGDVATVGRQALTQDSLLSYVRRVGTGVAGSYAIADAVAEGWLDLALVAEAAGSGLDPRDESLLGRAMAPWERTEHLRRLQNALAVLRPPLTEEELRRTYEGDSLRVYQRVFVAVSDWRDRAEVQEKRARADSILALAQAGASFDRLAEQLSQGPNAARGGFMGVVARRDVPPLFRDSLWALPPGAVSPVLPVDAGFQILRRPPLAEAHQQLAAHLLRVRGARADSILADSLAAAHGLALVPQTARRLRDVLTNPDSMPPDSLQVVRFSEGGVTPAEAWIWLSALPDGTRLLLARGSDVDLETAARTLARNELLYRMGRERGIDVRPEELSELRSEFVEGTDSVFAPFRGADAARRIELVDSVMEAVLGGRPARLLPAGLAPALRRSVPHAFDRRALADVARRATWETTADSLISGG